MSSPQPLIMIWKQTFRSKESTQQKYPVLYCDVDLSILGYNELIWSLYWNVLVCKSMLSNLPTVTKLNPVNESHLSSHRHRISYLSSQYHLFLFSMFISIVRIELLILNRLNALFHGEKSLLAFIFNRMQWLYGMDERWWCMRSLGRTASSEQLVSYLNTELLIFRASDIFQEHFPVKHLWFASLSRMHTR